MKKGRIFVVSAPSGSGKTTICKQVLAKIKDLAPSVSITTRPPRRDEKDKKDYYYVSRESFEGRIKDGRLLEWEENFGYLYGTPKNFVLKQLKKRKDLLLAIDVKGAMQVRQKFPKSVLIFIKTPSLKDLSKRLAERNTDEKSEITKRLKVAKQELAFMPRYDHVVINKKLDDAVKEVVSIIKKERK